MADHQNGHRLQWAPEHKVWWADWQRVVFSENSNFNFWNQDGLIRVRWYAGECCLPECFIERHSGRTPRVMVWDAILYPGQSQLLELRVMNILIRLATTYLCEVTFSSETAMKTRYQTQLEINAVPRLAVTAFDPNILNLIPRKQEHLPH
ncbi:transposable element Tc1 transposase [Trichonephila clavipes]|nr:transposable element Tc1 transposase [Trichonephila clavipes]